MILKLGLHLRLKSKSGLSLVELMIAAAILSIGVLAGVSSFHYISNSLQNSKARTLANNLAQEQIEKLKNLSYYTLLVTTSTYSDTRFSPPLAYDTGNYPAQTILEGGISYTRATRVDFAYQTAGAITAAPFTANDTGLKWITTFVIWRDGSTTRYMEMHNLLANPAANPLNASFTGLVKDPSNVPIGGALVQVVDNPNWFGFTNSAGIYQFSVSQGSYTLECSSRGFFTSTTQNYQSVASGQSKNVPFTLGRMSSGTAVGYAYLDDHLVISQVVGSTTNATSGFTQEYVELFNPTTYTWTIAINPTTPAINLKFDKQGAGGPATITMDYVNLTVGPGRYYLMANTTTVNAVGVARNADATFQTSNSGYPNIILINTDPGNDAASVGIAYATTGTWIDKVGWKTGGVDPPMLEGTAIVQVTGLQDNEQYVRRSSTGGVLSGLGRAFDSNNNNVDFAVASAPMIYPPRNTSDLETTITGTPAIGSYITFNDTLSNTGQCNAATFGAFTICSFNVPSIATGTWTMAVSSGAYYAEVNNVKINPSVSTAAPNGATSPAWPMSALPNTLLNNTTDHAFIAGVVSDANNNPLPGIAVNAGGVTGYTATNGRYFLSVPTGDLTLTANYGNLNKAYTSQSMPMTNLAIATMYDNPTGTNQTYFHLSLGGILRGYIRTGSNTPLPGRVAVALSGGSQVGQGVSGNDGYFYIANMTTGTYTVQPTLDPAEAASPTSTTVTLSSTGTATLVSTFTVTNGLAEITGQTIFSSNPITTGVLVMASTRTLTGTTTTPPPAQAGGTGILCNPCTYASSSDSVGMYSLAVRSSTSTPYYVYGWYTTFSGNTPTLNRRGPYTVNVSTAGQIVSQNLTW